MFDVLGQDGYKLHGELTRLDACFKQVETPDFDQCQGDSNLKYILKRMFDPPTKQPITGKGATNHHADCRSANGKLAVESTSESTSSCARSALPFLAGGGIAAAAAQSARSGDKTSGKESIPDEETVDDARSSGPHPFPDGGGIAAAAAAAVLAQNKKTLKESSQSAEDTATGNEADSSAPSGPPPSLIGGGIAAAAAAAALARNKRTSEVTDKSEDATSGDEPGSIAPSGLPPFLAGGGIAMAAAAAALSRKKKTSEETGNSEDAATSGDPGSDAHSGPPAYLAGGGIAAAAAAAALARNKKTSEETDKSEDATTGREPDSIAPSGSPPFLAGGGIAAAAAAAALARTKKTAEVSSEDVASPREFNEAASKPNESDCVGTGSRDGANPKNSLVAVGVTSNIGVIFSEKEMMKALIAEALNDASKHSRRISTLYCASSLCCLVASMMNSPPGLEIMPTDNSMKESPVLAENNTKEESSGRSFDVATRINGESTCTGNFSRQQEDGKETLHMTASGDQDEHGKEPHERSLPSDSEVVVDAVAEQEEKKEACDDASSPKGSPSMFSRLFGRKSMKGEKEETTDVGSGFDNATGAGGASCRTEDQPSENALEEPTSGKSTESAEDAFHASRR